MNKGLRFVLLLTLLLMLFGSAWQPAAAQDYYFQLTEKVVHAYWNEDGTLALYYKYAFQNSPTGHSIEYVDVAMPGWSFDMSTAWAKVDGQPVTDLSVSDYEGTGSGFAVVMGSHTIQPGDAGIVEVYIGGLTEVLYPDDDDPKYASAVFAPNTFDSSILSGSVDTTVVFHLPPGVQPEEPRWHSAPGGFNQEPETGFDDEGRVTYTWRNTAAEGDRVYNFGASFPAQYVPESAIVRKSWLEKMIDTVGEETIFGFCCFGIIVLIGLGTSFQSSRRQMKYLPPKISLEGHGIKRGLTAIEAAILLEQPLDRVLTMIMFAVIKKDAARVATEKPLQLEIANPLPESLRPYEVKFLEAFKEPAGPKREKVLQSTMIELVKSVADAMKGFSAKESAAYYRSIVDRAWDQVSAAATPEVKSQKYDEGMEWMMLDRNFDDRTRDVFRSTPVYVPRWWGNSSPSYRSGSSGGGASAQPSTTGSGGGLSMPVLPGSDFAASIVNQVQGFSGQVISNVSGFTSGVTSRTNPVPVSTSSGSTRSGGGGGGGRSCACACACAGCACACAGGGR